MGGDRIFDRFRGRPGRCIVALRCLTVDRRSAGRCYRNCRRHRNHVFRGQEPTAAMTSSMATGGQPSNGS